MHYIVDRIEGNYAVCEDLSHHQMVNLPLSNLPSGIQNGTCLIYKNQKYLLDKAYQKNRYNIIKAKFDKAKKHQP